MGERAHVLARGRRLVNARVRVHRAAAAIAAAGSAAALLAVLFGGRIFFILKLCASNLMFFLKFLLLYPRVLVRHEHLRD